MGANSSSEKEEIITHSRLGNVQLAETLVDEEIVTTLIITKALPSFEPVKNWLTFLREISPMYKFTKKSTNSSEKIMQFHFKQQTEILDLSSIFLPLQYSWKEEGFCGENGILQVFKFLLKVEYEGIMFDLQSEILNRREQGKYFLETEMWFLLYKLLQILKQFEKMKKRIGNLHPKNILLDEDGQIKLITKYSLMEELDGFQEKLADIHCSAFLCNLFFMNTAPEEVDDFNKTQTQYFHEKGEIYSLGLTILAAGTLTQGDEFYKVQLGSGELIVIDEELIGHKLTSFREHYSSFLSTVIELALRRNPYERRSGNQIYESLREYERDILDLHPFLPNQPIDQRKLNQSSKQKMLSINSYLISQDNLRPQVRK